MLAGYPLSRLDSYDGSVAPRHRVAGAFSAAVLAGLGLLGLLPTTVLLGSVAVSAAWLTATAAVAILALWTLCCAPGPGRASTALLLGEVLLWLLSPVFGLLGWVLRFPLLALAATGAWSVSRSWRPGYFPVVSTSRSRPFVGS
jgi:hypothetical protein